MKTKQLIIGLAIAGTLYYALGRKKSQPASESDTKNDVAVVDELEGRIVIVEGRGWVYLIKGSEAWAVTSDQALDDYIAQNPHISKGAVSITPEILKEYRIAGNISAGPTYNRD